MERMFDEHSFQDEVTNASEAGQCVNYLSHNESGFRRELASEGLSHEDIENTVRQVWANLLQSCQKAGFSNFITRAKTEQFGSKKQ